MRYAFEIEVSVEGDEWDRDKAIELMRGSLNVALTNLRGVEGGVERASTEQYAETKGMSHYERMVYEEIDE